MSGSPSSITSASSPVPSPIMLTQQQQQPHGQPQLLQQQLPHHQTSMSSSVSGQQAINLSYSSDLSANDNSVADSKKHKNESNSNSKAKVKNW